MNNQSKALTPAQRNSQFVATLQKQQSNIMKLLDGTGTSPERFLQIFINQICTAPKLRECTLQSKVMACLNIAQTGLDPDPNLGQVAIIPYNIFNPETRRKEMTATVQIMYKGFIEMGHRGGHISAIYGHVVYEKDLFDYDYGTGKTITHKPCREADRGEMDAAYAVVKYKDGVVDFLVMERHEIEKHKASSRGATAKDSPWNTWEDDMWRKTVVKKLARLLPKTPQLAAAIGLDDSAEIGKPQTASGVGDVLDLGEAETDVATTGGQADHWMDDRDVAPQQDPARVRAIQKGIFALCDQLQIAEAGRKAYIRKTYGVDSMNLMSELQLEAMWDGFKLAAEDSQQGKEEFDRIKEIIAPIKDLIE